MNRLWLGIGLLLALLAAGLLLQGQLAPFQETLAGELDRAAALSLSLDPAGAEALSGRVRQQWQRREHFLAAFTDHAPIEQIRALFAELSLLRPEDPEFASICVHLAQTMRAIGESHTVAWWSLL